MLSLPTKHAVIVGGPNGAGKTSWAVRNLPTVLGINEFINADEIARGLSPLDPDAGALAAGRLMLQRLDDLVAAGDSFAFETTCAGRGHHRLLKRCRAAGYQILLVYLWLPSVNMAIGRVAQRVTEGGHNIPTEVIIRRYSLGLRNMRYLYLPLADRVLIYDNSDEAGILIAEQAVGKTLVVLDHDRWRSIEEAT